MYKNTFILEAISKENACITNLSVIQFILIYDVSTYFVEHIYEFIGVISIIKTNI